MFDAIYLPFVFCTVVLGLTFIAKGKIWWGISVLFPVVVNTMMTMLIWWRFEEKKLKKWSWILVLSQIWPQFKAARIVYMFWNGHKSGNQDLMRHAERAKIEFQRGITTLEPFVESVPQVMILCNIWLKTSVIGTTLYNTEVTEDLEVLTGKTRWIFFCTFSISVLTASLGEELGVIFFKDFVYE